jgi:hypothetical protein
MGYRRMQKRDLWEIYRRWQAGQAISHIATGERRDRKTIRQYAKGFAELGLTPKASLMDEQGFYRLVEGLLPAHGDRPAPGSEQLVPYRDELRDLINNEKEALKPKTAFLVVSRKHSLSVSYATFKRFARQQGLASALCSYSDTSPVSGLFENAASRREYAMLVFTPSTEMRPCYPDTFLRPGPFHF